MGVGCQVLFCSYPKKHFFYFFSHCCIPIAHGKILRMMIEKFTGNRNVHSIGKYLVSPLFSRLMAFWEIFQGADTGQAVTTYPIVWSKKMILALSDRPRVQLSCQKTKTEQNYLRRPYCWLLYHFISSKMFEIRFLIAPSPCGNLCYKSK